MKNFEIIDPKNPKKEDKQERSKAQICSDLINKILVNHGCRFQMQTLIEESSIQHIIRIVEIEKKPIESDENKLN